MPQTANAPRDRTIHDALIVLKETTKIKWTTRTDTNWPEVMTGNLIQCKTNQAAVDAIQYGTIEENNDEMKVVIFYQVCVNYILIVYVTVLLLRRW